MPVSFWIFLIVCCVSFIPMIKDHGETWRSFKEATGRQRYKKGSHFFALWFIPVATLVGTLCLGYESLISDQKDIQRETQYRNVTNDLTASKRFIATQSNKLEQAESQLNAQSKTVDAVAWRSFTPEQTAYGIRFLGKYAGTKINMDALMFDSEATAFRLNLNILLKAAGWNPKIGVIVAAVSQIDGTPATGVEISVWSKNDLPAAFALETFLNDCKFKESVKLPDKWNDSADGLDSFIGAK
jgi:hypothetical protein